MGALESLMRFCSRLLIENNSTDSDGSQRLVLLVASRNRGLWRLFVFVRVSNGLGLTILTRQSLQTMLANNKKEERRLYCGRRRFLRRSIFWISEILSNIKNVRNQKDFSGAN